MSNEFREFMIQWNLKFPIDRWYREKYKIPFMSQQHRESSFLNMRLEWEEDQLFHYFKETEAYEPNKGDFLKAVDLTPEERARKARESLQNFPEELSDGQ